MYREIRIDLFTVSAIDSKHTPHVIFLKSYGGVLW